MRQWTGLLVVLAVLTSLVSAVPQASAADPGVVPGQYIVVLQPGADAPLVARDHSAAPLHVYPAAARGFAARLSPGQVSALRADRRVNNVLPDREYHVAARPPKSTPTPTPPPTPSEVIPTGVRRIGAASAVLGNTNTVVAVIDTGISPHADLPTPIVSQNFVRNEKTTDDLYGHGTHVAGTIAALAGNGVGVRGVAPGVDLANLRVCGRRGSCYLSDIIAAIDWITSNNLTSGTRKVQVANMSLSGGGSDTGNCGVNTAGTVVDAYHRALCDSAETGVVYVVAAGNDGENATYHTPAAYPEVIAVSAFADFNGEGGGKASDTCGSGNVDDTFASFSNYGEAVGITAPGVCIDSTWKDGTYRSLSGTSMATPHVAGAVALLVSQGRLTVAPSTSSTAARDSAMAALGKVDQSDSVFGISGDPDGSPEPVLYVGAQ